MQKCIGQSRRRFGQPGTNRLGASLRRSPILAGLRCESVRDGKGFAPITTPGRLGYWGGETSESDKPLVVACPSIAGLASRSGAKPANGTPHVFWCSHPLGLPAAIGLVQADDGIRCGVGQSSRLPSQRRAPCGIVFVDVTLLRDGYHEATTSNLKRRRRTA